MALTKVYFVIKRTKIQLFIDNFLKKNFQIKSVNIMEGKVKSTINYSVNLI
jgi:hypothetical protein